MVALIHLSPLGGAVMVPISFDWRRALIGTALCALPGVGWLEPPAVQASPAVPTPALCTGAVRLPIEVRVEPLDPIRRGASLRLRVVTTSERELKRGEVRVLSAGGAELQSAPRVAFSHVRPGGRATSQFTVRVPERGHRFLLQFSVIGDAEGGVIGRGATYNLLPDGPADPGRRVTTPDGRSIIEYAARRIEP
jgi:hypothetical protein